MRWLRENVGWIGLLYTITVGVVGLYVRSALASTELRSSQLEIREEQNRRERRLVLQKLDALCRATPNANCPLGVE